MMSQVSRNGPPERKAYVITGPTSGIGRATALELAKQGTVVLVGRDRAKLEDVRKTIEQRRQHAISVGCDLSDPASVQRAAAEILALHLSIAGLLNNAGIMQTKKPTKNALGWDMTFATNHLGPFALTEALVPHLPDGANVLFVVSAMEDPERRPAKVMGMRGGRYLSAEASARGEWKPGGASIPGMDSYATSKQCALAATLAFAREMPRLRFNAVEPGITPGTGLGGPNVLLGLLFRYVITFLPPFARYRSTPERTARFIAATLTEESGKTGVYYDEKGRPMLGSELARDPKFQERVVAETRAFLARIPK
jgi:NAD(P)-dependent dehydrogenase (short-subunit alcohol dehydrogenase family)